MENSDHLVDSDNRIYYRLIKKYQQPKAYHYLGYYDLIKKNITIYTDGLKNAALDYNETIEHFKIFSSGYLIGVRAADWCLSDNIFRLILLKFIDIFKKYNNDYKKYYNIFDNTVEFKLCCAFIGEICSNNDFQVECYKIKSEKFSKFKTFKEEDSFYEAFKYFMSINKISQSELSNNLFVEIIYFLDEELDRKKYLLNKYMF